MDYLLFNIKKITLTCLLLCYAIIIFAQTDITVGMTGAQVRNAINGNFDYVYSSLDTAGNMPTDIINVHNYGAIGNGTADDKIAIENAINAAVAIGGTVYFPSGTYYIGSDIAVDYSNKRIRFIGSGMSRIKGAGGTLSFYSTPGSPDTFVSNQLIGDGVIYTNSLFSSVSEGDLLLIKSTEKICNLSGNNYLKGEIVKVKRVVEDKILTYYPLYDNYWKDSTTIIKLNAGGLSMQDVTFDSLSLNVYQGDNIIIRDCRWNKTYNIVLLLNQVHTATIENNIIQRDTVATPVVNYGIDLATVQNALVTKNEVLNCVQGIVLGGVYPTRNVIVSNNNVSCFRQSSAQLDTHASCQYVSFIDNIIYNGGIYAGGQNIDIKGNKITLAQHDTWGIRRYEEDMLNKAWHNPPKSRYFNIIDNVIIAERDTLKSIAGIKITFTTYRDTIDWINISGNFVQTPVYALLFSAGATTGDYIRNMNIRNNHLESISKDASSYAVHFATIPSCGNVFMDNNTIKSHSIGSAFITDGSNSFSNFRMSNNRYYNPVWVMGCDTAIIDNNIFDKGIVIGYGGMFILKNNIFKATSASIGVYDLTSVYAESNIYNYAIPFGGTDISKVYRNESKYYTGSLTDGAPTASQINGIVGATAVQVLKGYQAVILDADGTGLTYKIQSDGTTWNYVVSTKAN